MSVLPEPRESELLQQLIAGDGSAFRALYDKYKGLLYIHAYRKLKNKEEARDIIQDIFLSIWERRERLNITESFSAYLYKSIRYKVIDRINKRNDAAAYQEHFQAFLNRYLTASADDADHLVRKKILTSIIEKEISQLPPKMRAVFELSRKSELSHKEIAEQLNLSEQTVRAHVKHALQILRTKLGLFLLLSILLHK
ncbi:RNA polymerase sigma-70 factor (ECF subfamily) [Pedobacter sp. AK017]|uniref:RNA polymerase sigma factor n=1 Tax=Pedobacter sp. AK017 TaxID=2723073 RepID=UPI00161CFA75|nr:RNA polymerase sigma-70 factor [Pedobacter sp. AK017]MBB5441359.1 RNA polymerase sigma-70 factor (ECF subfamily) [Pedobacter sp. AK017]